MILFNLRKLKFQNFLNFLHHTDPFKFFEIRKQELKATDLNQKHV